MAGLPETAVVWRSWRIVDVGTGSRHAECLLSGTGEDAHSKVLYLVWVYSLSFALIQQPIHAFCSGEYSIPKGGIPHDPITDYSGLPVDDRLQHVIH